MNIAPSLDAHNEHHYTKAAADNEDTAYSNIGITTTISLTSDSTIAITNTSVSTITNTNVIHYYYYYYYYYSLFLLPAQRGTAFCKKHPDIWISKPGY